MNNINLSTISSSDAKKASSLLKLINEDNIEQFSHNKLLSDGKYIVNHNFHDKGVRERTIEIKDSKVITEDYSFSQSSFFDVNHVVKKL
jgi:hypothetical protein